MELLAPAGAFDRLEAAVDFGADAVYLAGERFGMRARACNFSRDELREAVVFAHARDVRIYVTCNVLMSDADLAELPDYLRFLEEIGVDAVILSDLGALAVCRRVAPDLEIHVSTQASVSNAESARMWYGLGAKRIVLARELSLEQIAALRKAVPSELELEVFVHGSMCMAVSGRCLISAFLADRSGNKGDCAQSCRWNYVLEEEKRPGEFFPIEEDERGSYILNACDLNMLAHLDELRAAGVDSIKIEGRNKKAFYVASVVGAYRAVLDGAPAAGFERELELVSHRPYSTGFFFGPAPQAPATDGYITGCQHVADVLGSEPFDVGDGALSHRVTIVCRNRICESDVLEALVPLASPAELQVANLRWLPGVSGESAARPQIIANVAEDLPLVQLPADPADPDAAPHYAPVPVSVANRSRETYTFECAVPLPAGSYLRKITAQGE